MPCSQPFADGGREITAPDLIAAAATVVPLAKTAAEKIAKLRAWAAGRARSATTQSAIAPSAKATTRQLDFAAA